MMNKVYYAQNDRRWAKHPYPSPSLPYATIKSGGCGATSGAMIVSSFREMITPAEMGDIFLREGIRANGGTSTRAYPYIAKRWNLKMNKSVFLKDAIHCLECGGMVVAYLKAKSTFANGGHIIVLADIRGNDLVVYEPYLYNNKFNITYKGVNRRLANVRMNGVEALISIDNFKKYNNYTLYCYEAPEKPKIVPKFKLGEFVELEVPIKIFAQENDRYCVDDGSTQFKVHTSLIKNDILKARVNINWIEGNRYMVNVFGDQFWAKEENLKSYNRQLI